jgi:hypothetical protein
MKILFLLVIMASIMLASRYGTPRPAAQRTAD